MPQLKPPTNPTDLTPRCPLQITHFQPWPLRWVHHCPETAQRGNPFEGRGNARTSQTVEEVVFPVHAASPLVHSSPLGFCQDWILTAQMQSQQLMVRRTISEQRDPTLLAQGSVNMFAVRFFHAFASNWSSLSRSPALATPKFHCSPRFSPAPSAIG